MIRHAGLSVSVRCMNEECKMPSVGINYCDEAEAITAWNTRAAPTMKPWVWSDRPTSEYITKLTESTYVAYVENKLKAWLVP